MTIKRKLGLGGLSLLALFTASRINSSRGQSAPALSIAMTASNQVTLTITNGSNGIYNYYYASSLNTNPNWILLTTNSAAGATTCVVNLGDMVQGFFRAVSSTNFVPPTLTVIIQSPTNGALIY